jgi:hypothetical protein
MTGLLIFGLAVAVVLLTSLIKHVEWTAKTKNLLATALSTVGAAVATFVASGGKFEGGDLLQHALTIYGASQLIFKFIMDGSPIERKLAAVGSNVPPES